MKKGERSPRPLAGSTRAKFVYCGACGVEQAVSRCNDCGRPVCGACSAPSASFDGAQRVDVCEGSHRKSRTTSDKVHLDG